MEAALTRRDLFRYSAPALPLAFAGIPLYIYAPDFYAAQAGVPLASLGLVLLALRFVDALQDPFLGRLGDCFAHRRLFIMLLAAAIMLTGFAALFMPPASSPMLWFALSMFTATLGFSALGVQLNTIGALWRRGSDDKTRITSAREAFGLIGLLVAVLLPAILQQQMPAAEAFRYVALLLALLTIIAMLLFTRWYRRAAFDVPAKPSAEPSFWRMLSRLPPPTRRLFGIYALSMLASSMPALLILFFVRDLLQAEQLTGLFLAIYFIAGAAGMPLWQRLSKRYGKPSAWGAAMLLAVAAFVWAGALVSGDVVQFAIICAISGIAFGADLALPPSMLADHIEWQQAGRNASVQFGLLTFLLKAALALASAMVFPLLDAANFEPAASNSDSALLVLSLAYAIIPCAIKLAAALWLWCSRRLLDEGGFYATLNLNNGSHAHA